MLFFVGISFSIGAAVDGWRMDDPYPGYGSIARRKEEILREYRDQREQLINELEEIRNDAIANTESLAGEVETRHEQYKAIQQNISRCVLLFKSHIQYLEQCANSLLSDYRKANRTARTTPAPAHFSVAWQFRERPGLDAVSTAPDLDEALEQKVKDTLRELGSVRQRINEAFEVAVQEFKGLDEISVELAHGA